MTDNTIIEEVLTTINAAARLGVLDDQRAIVFEPVRAWFYVHLCFDPPDLLDRPGATRDGWKGNAQERAPVIARRGYVQHSENEWGPLSLDGAHRLTDQIMRRRVGDLRVVLWVVATHGVREAIIHVKHPTGTKAMHWKLRPVTSVNDFDTVTRITTL